MTRTPARLLAVVAVVMMSLFLMTGFVTGKYRREKHQRAENQFEAGQRLASEGRYEESIEQYTEALTLSRDHPEYRQALALALMQIGRSKEAEAYLKELLRTDPANAVANLMLARIYSERKNIDNATGYYQRAIYGLWPEEPAKYRIETRFELIDLLKEEGEYNEMEAELLRLMGEIPDDPALKKRIGHLFLAAQSSQNAADLFSEVVKADSRDAEAYAGLGDAEFEMGHYLSARTAYHQALQYNSDDLQSSTQLDLANVILDLDPMSRGLGSSTQLRRSQQLVKRAVASLDYCLPEDLQTLPEDFRKAVEQGRRIAGGKLRQQRTMENVEANIALAEELEAQRTTNCGSPPVPDRALELLLKKLAD